MSKQLLVLACLIASLTVSPAMAVEPKGLIGYWPLDGDTLDASGLGNDATAQGDPEFVDGLKGQAVYLDGDDYLTMDGVANDLTDNNVTMSAWVKTLDDGDWFSVNTATGGNVALFGITGGLAAMYDGGYEGHSSTTVADDEWHMLTYVRLDSTGYVYVDAVNQNSHEANFTLSPDDRWSIGQEWDSNDASDFLVGTVDEVCVYGVALDASQITDMLYDSAAAPAAWMPNPTDGAEDVTSNPQLIWAPGADATAHTIYLGISQAAVAAGDAETLQGTQTDSSFATGTLVPGSTYYWRVDETDAGGTVTTGPVWSFTTVESIDLEDFESYTDVEPDRIFDFWWDGWDNEENGSIVGHEESPFAEQEIVHGGTQSMIFAYDNSDTAMISEAQYVMEAPVDITVGGITGVTLWYHGLPASVGGVSYDEATQSYTMTGAGEDIAEYADSFHFAYQPFDGNGSITARIDSLQNTNSWAKAGIMIRNGLDPKSAHAMVCVTPTHRVAFLYRLGEYNATGVTSTATDAITLPHWVRLTRADNILTAEHSSDGVNWVPVESADPEALSTSRLPSNGTTYAGLAVTARQDDGTPCEAVFSQVAINGSAAGTFADSTDIGISSNSSETMYVGLGDTSDTIAYVYHDNGTDATNTSDWQVWPIPLEAFSAAGVDLTSVNQIVLGVGDRDNPQTGGTGVIYFDDIQAVRRLPSLTGTRLFEEDFDSLALGSNVDEALAGDEVWTKTAPDGWTIDDSGVPGAGDPTTDGVTEWAGWSFADRAWWTDTAGDQQRSQFTLGSDVVAVIDPDEWDDQDHTEGLLSSYLSTPEIDVTSVAAGDDTLELQFDSTWRREDTQTAHITVSFDGGEPIEITRWESEGADTGHLKNDATNETVKLSFARPEGAGTLVVTFGMSQAGNDWWWAIDNVQVRGVIRERTVIYTENFETVALGENIEEGTIEAEVWTEIGPEGWSIDESSIPGIGDPEVDGVTEWAGWCFANKDWWIDVAGGQRRSEFELGEGTVAIADPDEWDDAAHPEGYNVAETPYATWMSTPSIDIAGFGGNSIQLKFDSSWRPEFDSNYHQTANLTVSFDGGESVEVLRWESEPTSPYYKDDNSTNDTIVIDLENPGDATTMVLTFGLFEAGNDWWWAIDNIVVTAVPME